MLLVKLQHSDWSYTVTKINYTLQKIHVIISRSEIQLWQVDTLIDGHLSSLGAFAAPSTEAIIQKI